MHTTKSWTRDQGFLLLLVIGIFGAHAHALTLQPGDPPYAQKAYERQPAKSGVAHPTT